MRVLTRLLRWAVGGSLALGALAGVAVIYVLQVYGRDLPDYRQLANYAPAIVSRLHAGDGRLLVEYAQEKRVLVPISAMPRNLTEAFISAEDKNFYHHFGIDPISILGASVSNVGRLMRGNTRFLGASTITQQVAKNFLLTNERTLPRKIKEAILSLRIERTYGKDKILELYLNEIYLGRGSYGVAAAALNYFDKSLTELTLAEAAFLAGLPQAPSRYDPVGNAAAARARRDYVIDRMEIDGKIDAASAAEARAQPIEVRRRGATEFVSADYFADEARRRLVAAFGEDVLYRGGLSVRTTLDARIQAITDKALRDGLSAYDRSQGWRGALGRIDLAEAGDAWPETLAKLDLGFSLGGWRRAIVLETAAAGVRLGFDDGTEATMSAEAMAWAGQPREILSVGDIVVVEPATGAEGSVSYSLRQEPEVEGAVVALDPHTGRVFALTGGFSFQRSSFNRATQAKRQPGSSFKPFVYLAALEHGYTPSSIVLDAPLVIDQGPGLPLWRPDNYTTRFYGPTTLRVGVERSRNVMTVRLAQELGMERVVDVARRFGIAGGLGTNLAAALGSNEVDLLSLTAAYGELVNGGKRIEPTLFDRLQDRFGRTIAIGEQRATCPSCQVAAYDGGQPPALPDPRAQIEDPRIAYQMVNILTGVVERGTGRAAAGLGVPMGGKTGTSNDVKDAWFVGFTPDLVLGVFVGYDQPRPMGDHQGGATLAAPIFVEAMEGILKDTKPVPFRVPPGVQLVRVDAETGGLPNADTQSVILEAFLPGTQPARNAVTAARPSDSEGYGSASSRRAGSRPAVSSGGLY
ncbi:penicillin-binding protein 1A [Marinivivus vitaminiproducens]|uniref:penicillin-binding protein 1A n=1 Tax=Marinivivus vitaminiproducens TaxID=3035935 RepID=UPI0027A3BF8D|nr:penicillin-binding protein 1A [Geminicoccaceae bacterium SCSIO 64248]